MGHVATMAEDLDHCIVRVTNSHSKMHHISTPSKFFQAKKIHSFTKLLLPFYQRGSWIIGIRWIHLHLRFFFTARYPNSPYFLLKELFIYLFQTIISGIYSLNFGGVVDLLVDFFCQSVHPGKKKQKQKPRRGKSLKA